MRKATAPCFLVTITCLVLGCNLASAAGVDSRQVPNDVAIYDHNYELLLIENVGLANKLQSGHEVSEGKHYRGKLTAHDNSWVRVSNIGGSWTGLVYFNEEMFTVKGAKTESGRLEAAISGQPVPLVASPVQAYDRFTCGTPGHAHDLYPSAQHSALQSPASIPLATLCDESVGIHCAFAEMEFVFDPAFRQIFPIDTEAVALSIINMAEGPYLNQLGIGFDSITFRLHGSSEFSATTDASALIDDIFNKRQNGSIPDDVNDESIFHLVTGRDFDGDTVGVAYLDTLCSTAAIGSTQVVNSLAGGRDTRLTALVIAHEIGHNFGADHDVDDNSCGQGHVMGPIADGGASFSSCSLSQLETAVSNVVNLSSCFNFPVALRSKPADTNVRSVGVGGLFTHEFEVMARAGYRPIETLLATGSIAPGHGLFNTATLDNVPCEISSGGSAYQCLRSSPDELLTLSYTIQQTGSAGEVLVTDRLEVVGVADNELALTNTVLPIIDTRTRVDHAPPNPASNLTALFYEEQAASPIDLEWEDNSNDEDGFRIERRLDNEPFEEIAVTTWTDYRDVTTIERGARYEYRVIAFNAAGDAPASNATRAELRVPDQIGSLSVEFVNDAHIFLQWGGQLSNIEDGIRIERSVDGSNFVEIGSVNADVTEFVDLNPVYGSVNAYRVIAFNKAGDAPPSDIDSITPIIVPISVDAVAANQRAGTTIVDVSWIERSHNEDGFRIERREQGGAFVEIGIVGANETRFTDPGASENTFYEYQIIAFNVHGNSDVSTMAGVAVVGIPTAPTSVVATQNSGTSVGIRWIDNSSNEVGFSILRSENSMDFIVMTNVAADSISVTDSDTTIGTTYRYRVVAFNLAGDSVASESTPITVVSAPPPGGGSTGNPGGGGGGGGSFGYWCLFATALIWLRRALAAPAPNKSALHSIQRKSDNILS